MSLCLSYGCYNIGNPAKRGFCYTHDCLTTTTPSQTSQIHLCRRPHCMIARFCSSSEPRQSLYINGFELPAGFTEIITRHPAIGDVIITTIEIGLWLSNSYGVIVEVIDVKLGKVLVHFACDAYHVLCYSRGQFVIID
jgi:hypothetical protein